jgi:2-C-methyl-D-erythritol 2,4-cyclodiphosphate synthase
MIGFGFDIHKLAENESLILGGIKVESPVGTVAHSDGDVVLHALVDAMLGAAGLGDIGEHFPDSDEQYKGKESKFFVEKTLQLLKENLFYVINTDITIVLEQPKLSPYKDKIKKNIAEMLKISEDRVNVKAKTSEKLGFVGRQEGISAYCVVLLEKYQKRYH